MRKPQCCPIWESTRRSSAFQLRPERAGLALPENRLHHERTRTASYATVRGESSQGHQQGGDICLLFAKLLLVNDTVDERFECERGS